MQRREQPISRALPTSPKWQRLIQMGLMVVTGFATGGLLAMWKVREAIAALGSVYQAFEASLALHSLLERLIPLYFFFGGLLLLALLLWVSLWFVGGVRRLLNRTFPLKRG